MNIALIEDGRSTRWDAHRTQRRRELVKKAVTAINTLGPGASMGDIARSAQTSKSVFYRYFDDKAGLQAAVAERVLANMRRRLLEAAGPEENAFEALKLMVGEYFRLIESAPHVYSFVTAGTDSEEVQGFFSSLRELLSSSLAKIAEESMEFEKLTGHPASREEPEKTQANLTILHWPSAALGLIRSCGESWLYSPTDQRVSAKTMRDLVTSWLASGIFGKPSQALATTKHSPTTEGRS